MNFTKRTLTVKTTTVRVDAQGNETVEKTESTRTLKEGEHAPEVADIEKKMNDWFESFGNWFKGFPKL